MNHIYLSDNFYLIDTDFFNTDINYSDEIYKCNLSQVNFCIKSLFDGLVSSDLKLNVGKSILSKEEFVDDMISEIKIITDNSVNSLLTLKNYKRG